jgi:pimeloyl-ACP methyl ester carboxylesterase
MTNTNSSEPLQTTDKSPETAENNNQHMQSRSIAVYSHDLEVFRLNVVTNTHFEGKQTLLLLHGYLGSTKDYTPFFEKFANSYNIVAIDLRGHGESESPKTNWTIDDLVFDVYQIVRLLVPENKRIIIVGNSLSTAITLKFASKYPERVKNIFLISPTSKFSLPFKRKISINFLNIMPNRTISSLLSWMNNLAPKLIKSENMKEFTKMAMEKIIHVPVAAHKKILRATLPSYQFDASEFQIPMMIIAGEHDNIVPFTHSVDLNSTAKNSSILMLKNTKHRILVTRTDLVLNIFEQWIHTHSELLTDVEHYHETDLINNEEGNLMLPEDWVNSDCTIEH